MKKSVKKFYGHKRKWDFEEWRTQIQKKVTKHRAHKRLRHQLQKEMNRDLNQV